MIYVFDNCSGIKILHSLVSVVASLPIFAQFSENSFVFRRRPKAVMRSIPRVARSYKFYELHKSTYFIDPKSELNPPICPTPPNNCISCCCDILFNIYCKSPLSLLLRFAEGGLFIISFTRRQYSSSLSVLGSCNQKKRRRVDDLNFSTNTRPVFTVSIRLNTQSSGKTIKSSST